MEIKEFVKNFASLFEDTDANEFSEESKFREFEEWSSFMALSVMAMSDEMYGIKLNGEDIQSSKTINDLFEIVKSRIK